MINVGTPMNEPKEVMKQMGTCGGGAGGGGGGGGGGGHKNERVSGEGIELVEKVKRVPASPENVKAATKMQSMFRKKKAKEKVDTLKKISGELKELEGELSGEWSCPACTYVNPNSRSKCEMCDTPKPLVISAAARS